MGDIGNHFPDTEAEWKNVSSLLLLEKVVEIIRKKGFQVGNIDSTLVLQQPKVSTYVFQMRKNISKVLNIDIEQVSVKATTTEGLGFEGRGEGISAQASCLLYKYRI